MKKRITYEIHGQIERNCYFRIGKALVRIEFAGGSINSTGVSPAHYVTENALFQKAIENSEIFRSGEIKRGKVEIIEEAGDNEAAVAKDCGIVCDNTKAFPEVTNMQQARSVLMASPYNCTLAQLQTKNAIKTVAQANGVTFPDWL